MTPEAGDLRPVPGDGPTEEFARPNFAVPTEAVKENPYARATTFSHLLTIYEWENIKQVGEVRKFKETIDKLVDGKVTLGDIKPVEMQDHCERILGEVNAQIRVVIEGTRKVIREFTGNISAPAGEYNASAVIKHKIGRALGLNIYVAEKQFDDLVVGRSNILLECPFVFNYPFGGDVLGVRNYLKRRREAAFPDSGEETTL